MSFTVYKNQPLLWPALRGHVEASLLSKMASTEPRTRIWRVVFAKDYMSIVNITSQIVTLRIPFYVSIF